MKMQKIRNLILILCIFLFAGSAQAQQPDLVISFDTAQGLPPSTISRYDNFNFGVKVRNDSLFNFKDTISFAYSINAGSIYVGPDFTSGFSFPLQNDSVPPGTSILRTIHVIVDSPQFMVGPSVVVIWPIIDQNANGHHGDSLIFVMNVVDSVVSGINDDNNVRMKLYVGENGLLLMHDAEINIHELKVVDVLGREILRMAEPP